MSDALGWPLVGLLLIGSFVLSGLETACLAITRARLRFESRRGSFKAMKLARLIDEREQLLVAIMIVNNALNVVAFALVTIMLAGSLGLWGYPIAFLVSLPVYLLWCELLPKSLFGHFPFRLLMRFSLLLQFFHFVSAPLGAMFPSLRQPSEVSAAALDRGREAFRQLTSAIQKDGALNPDETALIQHVLDFEKVEARHLMIPLRNVTAIPLDMPLAAVTQLARETNYDQFPVMSSTGDLVGLVRVFEVLKAGGTGDRISDFIRRLVRASADEPAIEVLQRLRLAKLELAVVYNARSRPVGIISSRDIVGALMRAEPSDVFS